LLKAGAVLVASAPTLPSAAVAQGLERADTRTVDPIMRESADPKGGTIVSLDRQVGDFEQGDVLIQGKRIVAAAPNFESSGANPRRCSP
jgi:hypothetical protein